ncbi:MAG: amidase [Alphaproteobacteria bacterium]
MNADEICALSAVELVRSTRDGSLLVETVVDAVLARVEKYDSRYRAFALVDKDGARQAARSADIARANGEVLGALHGIPFSVKDVILTEGLETTFGSKLMAGNIPDRDASAVARLKAAGAVLIGKTTTPEFAHKTLTDSPKYGVTRNPWNLEFSPGGSSGGAAVATATGMGPLAVTTDGAGSSRIPASCCGVLGLKATLGRIANESAADLFSNFSYIGAITRTTGDLSAMLNVMTGSHPGDPWTRAAVCPPCKIPADPMMAIRGLRVHYKPYLGNHLLDDSVSEAMERTLVILADAGVAITRSDGKEEWGNEMARVAIRGLISARMAHYSEDERQLMDPSLSASIIEGDAISAKAAKEVPLLRSALYRQTEEIFADSDLLLTPCVSAPPPRAGHNALDPIEINGKIAGPLRANWYNYPAPFNLTGHPAISIPAGQTAEGLPTGLQAVAPWFGEQRLIDLAALLERLQPWSMPSNLVLANKRADVLKPDKFYID